MQRIEVRLASAVAQVRQRRCCAFRSACMPRSGTAVVCQQDAGGGASIGAGGWQCTERRRSPRSRLRSLARLQVSFMTCNHDLHLH